MKTLDENYKALIKRELDSIESKAPPCPDPAEGGCIGNHCILCSVRDVASVLRQHGIIDGPSP